MRLALFGGVYNNYLALEAACRQARKLGCERIYCLGDMGAFGPHPDRVFPLLKQYGVICLQGNYDDSVGNGLDDCQCGYTDPRDNYFAHVSYQYTLRHTSAENRAFLAALPKEIRFTVGDRRILLCHGSPRRVNEFLWETTTPDHLLERFFRDYEADIILATHSGLHWKRPLDSDRWFVNVGVIGRPANDGNTHVWMTVLDTEQPDPATFVPVTYDYRRLADEMNREQLPEEFIETIVTGWWTTCLEILPAKERKKGRY